MSSDVSRRDFLVRTGLAAAVCAAPAPLRAAAPQYKLALGQWSFHRAPGQDARPPRLRADGEARLRVRRAKAISVKAHSFDAQGHETRTDFAKMFKIVVDGGYRGPYLEIEYEGDGVSEADGVRKAKALVERTLAAL